MNAIELNRAMTTYTELTAKIDELKAQAEEARAYIEKVMIDCNMSEYVSNEGIARLTDYTANTFNTNAFKKDYKALYDQYLKSTTKRRFSITH